MSKEPWIIESQLRCEQLQLGLDPLHIPSLSILFSDAEVDDKRNDYEEILSVIHFFVDKMLELMKGIPLLIIITDENGCILEMAGDTAIKNVISESGIRVGLVFEEKEAGTNSINLSLAHRKPIQLIGDDHFFHFLKGSACYSVPFQYADINNLLGTITIMTTMDQHNPFLLAMLSTVVDSIERELLLRKQNRTLHILNQIVIETTRNGIIITDREGHITECNKLAEILTQSIKKDVLQKPIAEPKINKFIQEVLHSGVEYENIELIMYHNNPEQQLVCLFDAFPIHDENMQLLGAFAQFRDITERYNVQNQINYLAHHDDLTGLPNRRFFTQQLSKLLDESAEDNRIFAVMFLDLDRFKKINDNLGHNHGDILLRLVAQRLQTYCEPFNYVVSRMGGDEFTILLQDIKLESQAVQFAESLIQAFEQTFAVDEYDIYITTSIGIAYYPRDGTDADTLMKHADIAMYMAKDEGNNNYSLFKPLKNNATIEQLSLESSIRKALQNEQFVLYYQPQVDIISGHVIGIEALIRWQHPNLGLVPPGKFIPIAEQTGLIGPIGEWVLETACKQNQTWIEHGYEPVKVSVNISARQFLKQNFVDTIKRILADTQLDPQYLELEITESMTMDVDVAIDVLGQLKQLGIQICIDDFGTGYSNLYYLKLFSIDRLKIDRSFIRDMMTDTIDADIVATIIAMAHNLGIDVIAEGVETEEQLNFLRTEGCYEVQGFYYHTPLPENQIEMLFMRQESYR